MPQSFVAYAPRGAGLLVAMTYIVDSVNVAGWWIGHRDYSYESAYFLLENFYSTHPTEFFASTGSDIYGGWRDNFARRPSQLQSPIRVEDALCHRLAEMQDAFASEWLFFDTDNNAQAELTQYAEAELALRDVNIRFEKLTRLNREAPVWRYQSHAFEYRVLDYMQSRWPLDYREG